MDRNKAELLHELNRAIIRFRGSYSVWSNAQGMPSKRLSSMMPSGVSGIFSIAESTFTPLSLSVFLWIAVSYLLRENLSNL